MMKKTLKVMAMLFFVVSMTALTSCSKKSEKLIVGKWECIAASYTENGETQSFTELNGMIWEFKSDGTVVGSMPEDFDDGTDLSVTYVIVDDQLTMSYVDEDGDLDKETYTIKELTKSKLVLEEVVGSESVTFEFKKL